MIRFALRNLRHGSLRLAVTALSVVAGVAFVAGTLIFTDTVRADFDQLLGDLGAGVDVVVRPAAGPQDPTDTASITIPDAVAESVADVAGVAAVAGVHQGPTLLLAPDGSPLVGQAAGSRFGGPPTVANWITDDALRDQTLHRGRPPADGDEIAVSTTTARTQGLAVGDDVRVVLPDGSLPATVVGTFGYPGGVEPLGAPSVAIDTATAEDKLGGPSMLRVRTAPGAHTDAMRTSIASTIDTGDAYEVVAGDRAAQDVRDQTGAFLMFIAGGLLGFAAIALLVAAAIIFVTFTATTASRTRQYALLRAVGATRRNVVAAVLVEAAAIGVSASVLGVAAGFALALGMHVLLSASGIPLPAVSAADLVLRPRTIAVAGVVGVVVTTLAALLPALRVGRTPPVRALAGADVRVASATISRRRCVAGVIAAAVTVVCLAAGIAAGLAFDEASILTTPLVVVSAVGLVVALVLLAPRYTAPAVRAMVAVTGALRGIPGQLASRNAARNPTRTAATAAAMTIGVALTSFLLILGASLQASADADLRREFFADFQLDPANFASFPAEAVDAVATVDAVETATPVRFARVGVADQPQLAAGVEPSTLLDAAAVSVTSGRLTDLDVDTARPGQPPRIALADDAARRLGVDVGDETALRLPGDGPAAGSQNADVVATYDGDTLALGRTVDALVAHDRLATAAPSAGEDRAYVVLRDGITPAQARPGIEAALRPYPTAQLLDREQASARVQAGVGQVTGVGLGLLALSVLVAVFGITNTLGLSVLERTREIGMLRAVGASRRTIRAMVRWEAVTIASLGGICGLLIGVLFGFATVTAAPAEFGVFALPAPQLALVAVAAAAAGVLAAIAPARRAGRLPVLDAIAAE